MVRTEEFNLREEIKEDIKKFLRKGIDNEYSAIFRVMRKDQYSPKGMALMLDNGYYAEIFYQCNLDGIPDVEFSEIMQKARRILVLRGQELEVNKEMVKNVRDTGNIYGMQG